MNKLGSSYIGWDTERHLQAFDFWNRMSDLEFNFTYGSFSEQMYLLESVQLFENPTYRNDTTMRQQKRDLDRIRSVVTHGRTSSSNKTIEVEREFNIMDLALGQSHDTNTQLCIYRRLHKKFPKHIINLIIANNPIICL